MNINIKDDNLDKEASFMCSQCGACCSQLNEFHGVYDFLDRGDGQCNHFNENTNTCEVYESRPNLCRVEYGYTKFKSIMPYVEYVAKTKEACRHLQRIKFGEKIV